MDFFLYATIIFVVLFVAFQVYMQTIGHFKKGKKISNIPPDLLRKIERHPQTLLYFYTPKCSACRTMNPLIGRLSQKFPNIIKIDLLEETELGRIFGILGTPTIVLMERTTIRYFGVGVRKEAFLRSLLQKGISS
jgi:thioredoxin 1